jgi:uncharacterized membrane protein YeiH
MIYLLDLFGVAVFAVTGSLAAGKRRLDLFGVVVVALATALGGGTFRDVTLGTHPIFWISDPAYILVAVSASVMTFASARFREPPKGMLQVADAFGLAIFTVIGAQKALNLEVSPIIVVIMGIMTGVAGGMIRDILSGEIPLILQREIYATASLCGALAFVGLAPFVPTERINIVVAVVVVLALRLAAIRWKLSLPVFPSSDPSDSY